MSRMPSKASGMRLKPDEMRSQAGQMLASSRRRPSLTRQMQVAASGMLVNAVRRRVNANLLHVRRIRR